MAIIEVPIEVCDRCGKRHDPGSTGNLIGFQFRMEIGTKIIRNGSEEDVINPKGTSSKRFSDDGEVYRVAYVDVCKSCFRMICQSVNSIVRQKDLVLIPEDILKSTRRRRKEAEAEEDTGPRVRKSGGNGSVLVEPEPVPKDEPLKEEPPLPEKTGEKKVRKSGGKDGQASK